MTKFTDYKSFVDQTGMIFDSPKLVKLGIVPLTCLGVFGPRQLEELIEFCQTNPTYHVVSQLNANAIINRVSKSANLYFLADGNPDKRFVFLRS